MLKRILTFGMLVVVLTGCQTSKVKASSSPIVFQNHCVAFRQVDFDNTLSIPDSKQLNTINELLANKNAPDSVKKKLFKELNDELHANNAKAIGLVQIDCEKIKK